MTEPIIKVDEFGSVTISTGQPLYYVCWRSGNLTGRGEKPAPKHIAEAWITEMNRKYEDVVHWLEEAQ